MAVDLRQTHFRFGIEELLENTHGWHAAEDVNPASGVLPLDAPFLLRFTEQEAGATAAANTDAVFQYSRNGGAWTDITTATTVVRAVASVAFTNGQACTQRLGGTGTFETSGAGCTEDGSSGGAANDIAASGNSETECGLQIISADVAAGDVLEFRFRSPDWTVTYTVTPKYILPHQPGVGVLTLEGFAPTIAIQAPNVTVTPGTGVLDLVGFAPTVLTPIVVLPDVGTLSLAGFAPTVLIATLVQPGAGVLTLAGFAPIIAITHAGTILTYSITPGTSFTIVSNDAQDTGTISWMIVEAS